MTLIVEKTQKYDRAFVEWLLEYTKALLKRVLVPQKLIVFDKKLHTKKYEHLMPQHMNIYQILLISIESLAIKENETYYEIYIPNIKKIGKLKLKLKILCSFVNYGNQSTKSFPIFTKTFNYIGRHLEKLYKVYTVHSVIGDKI